MVSEQIGDSGDLWPATPGGSPTSSFKIVVYAARLLTSSTEHAHDVAMTGSSGRCLELTQFQILHMLLAQTDKTRGQTGIFVNLEAILVKRYNP